MGARIQLDPSIDCNGRPRLVGAAEWKRVECRTLQKYSAIVTDTGTGIANDDSRNQFVGLLGFSATDTNPPFDLVSHLLSDRLDEVDKRLAAERTRSDSDDKRPSRGWTNLNGPAADSPAFGCCSVLDPYCC
jgi:hypothetical protein